MSFITRLIKVTSLVFVLVLVFSTTVFATSVNGGEKKMTLEEAEKYITNYEKTVLNEDGTETKITFNFTNKEDLKRIAEYITEYGVKSFEKTVNEELGITNEEFQNSETPEKAVSIPVPIINKTINTNGIRTITGEYTNIVSFDKGGRVEYLAELSCRVTSKNGKITDITSLNFNMEYISKYGGFNNVKLTKSVNNSVVGSVTATYDISNTTYIIIKGVSVPVTQKKQDSFVIVITFVK